MEDLNEEEQIDIMNKPKNEDDIINIAKYLEGESEDIQILEEKNLCYFFSNRDIYNEKGTKLKSKEDFLTLMNLLNEYIKENTDFIFLYFKKINIELLKVAINGYITSDIENAEQNEFLLKIIKDLILLFYSKDIFYLIYNKLSKIFRRFNSIGDKENLFNKFYKIFQLWKMIYNIDERNKLNSNYFTLMGGQILVLVNLNNRNEYQFKKVKINIEFDEDFCDINGKDNELINVWYFDYGSKGFKYGDIKKNKEEKIKEILIKIKEESIEYTLNKVTNKELDENNHGKYVQTIKLKLDKPSNFVKIDILKNYIGKIKKISIKIEFKDKNLPKYDYEIIPVNNEQYYEINSNETIEGLIKLHFQPENKTKLISNKTYNDLLYEDIRYYGGMESFIPIIKIIKYFISTYKENENKMLKLNETLIDIIRNIIKFMFYSKDNFENFKKILVPLIGSLAEINQVIPKNMKDNLYSNNAFSLLYIIIISSSMPFSIKKSYIKITDLYTIDNLNLNFEELIIDTNKLRFNSYEWYITMLAIIIEFIILSFNTTNKVPKFFINNILNLYKKVKEEQNQDLQNIKTKISNLLKNIILSFNYISKLGNDDSVLFEKCQKIKDISKYFKENFINNKDNINFPLLMIKIYLNLINYESFWFKLDLEIIKSEEKKEEENKNEIVKNNYKNIFENFFNNFEKLSKGISKEIKDLIQTEFGDYIKNRVYLNIIFPFLTANDFKLQSEIVLSELIDFHREYHNLMKNNFIFNKLWSDKKLFFDEQKKNKYLKYKSINYYTKNYQRPFLYPDLDYKYSYPIFSQFEVKNYFFMDEENPDDYNFNLDCQDFDNFNINYEREILKNVHKNFKLISFDVCLVKRTHHIKGKIYICNDANSLIKKVIFYSYPPNVVKKIPCCNSSSKINQNKDKEDKEEDKEKLCFGAIFKCPEKYMNMKIIINVKDIRMVLKKIYFYKKSAVEIYTKNKSYLFNFAFAQCEKNCSDFTNMFAFFISEFSPIVINKESNVEIIGHSRRFEAILKSYNLKGSKYDISKEGNKFISSLFDHWTSDVLNVEFSALDLLIYLNLLSNRSYNDLFQYPVFPLLFMYDKIKDKGYNIVDRKLDLHIGFQDLTQSSKDRKNLIKSTYDNLMKEFNDTEGNEEMEIPSYFTTHFSNSFYVTNFMVRIFPYTFLSIEQQGAGFDNPNRLFFSIEDAFYHISYLKSDLRELIPEFYYFPEIFWNINKIDFDKRENGIQVDDVEMPQDISKIDKEKIKNNVNLNDEYEKSNYFLAFKFVEKMRNLLESKNTDIISWINIIFGPKQKYQDSKKEDLYFRYESYIDYTDNKKNELKYYSQDKASMAGVEFGITPIQTVFEGDTGVRKNKNIIYNSTFKENKESFTILCKLYTERIKPKNVKDNKNKENNTNNKDNTFNKNRNIIKYSKGLYKIIDVIKTKKGKTFEENQCQNNNIFLEPELNIKCIFQNENVKIIGYKTGKIEVFQANENKDFELVSEFFDHNDEINHLNYNPRLNMICSTSKDGFLNVYSLPNKLITTIKNPNKNNFGLVFLSSNPFPSIITLEKDSGNIFSYSINGFKIKSTNIYNMFKIKKDAKIDLYVFSHFNENGGTFKDRLIFIENNVVKKDNLFKCHFIRVPFFEEEEKTIDLKVK